MTRTLRWSNLVTAAAIVAAGCGAKPEGAKTSRAKSTLASTSPASSRERGNIMARGTSSPIPANTDPTHPTYGGGAVITDVQVAIVYWGTPNDTIRTTIPGFYSALTNNPYMDWLQEYNTPTQGICRGSMVGAFTITPSNTHTTLFQTEIEAELAHQIDIGALNDVNNDPLNPNRFYAIYFPPGITQITSSFGQVSCSQFCAFHESFTHNGKQVRYSVIPDLGSNGCDQGCGGGSYIQNTESASSHELLEAVTDPDPFSGWTPEIGDICNQQQATLPGTGFTVQAMWSTAAQACVVARAVPVAPPHIDSITPADGPYNSTTWVNLAGSCFANSSVSVSKNGQTAAGSLLGSTNNSPTFLEVNLPASPDGTPGFGSVILGNAGQAATSSINFDYFYVGPTNVVLSPDTGPMQGGTAVTITGQNLLRSGVYNPTVTFDGVPSPNVWCQDSTKCIVASPVHDPGSVQVVVTADGPATASNNFTYQGPTITSIVPNHGPITGGTQVTIHGHAFLSNSQINPLATVHIGGASLGSCVLFREGSDADGECTLTMPANVLSPGTYDVQVTLNNVNGDPFTSPVGASSDKFTFTALPQPISLTCNGTAVGGGSIACTVQLDGYAPAGGASVGLAEMAGGPSGVISMPGSFVISSGSWGSFNVSIVSESYTGAVPISATYGGVTASTTINVYPTPSPTISTVASGCGAQSYSGTVTLAEPAPSAGAWVFLTATNATVTPQVWVNGGSTTSQPFTLTTPSVTTPTTATINGTYFGVAAAPANVTLLPNGSASLTFSPISIPSGGTSNGTLALCAASNPPTATVSSSSAFAHVPSSIPLSGGVGTFTLSAGSPTVNVSATITGSAGGASASAKVTILRASGGGGGCGTPAQCCIQAGGSWNGHQCL
jgi:hypothetical protein